MRFISVVLCLFSAVLTYAQLDTAKFQKIGFGDWYTLSVDRSLNGSHLTDSNYYSDAMIELGLTQLVAYADNALTLYEPISIIDKSIQRFQTDTAFLPFVYAVSTGNDIEHFPYQIGGPIVNDLTPETSYGFGDKNNTSLWVLPPSFFTTGDQNKADTKDGETILTYYADAALGHTPGLALVLAETHNYHQPFDRAGNYYFRDTNKIFYYRVSLNMKIDSAATVNDTIAEVIVWEIDDPGDLPLPGQGNTINVDPESTENNYLFPITGDRFTPGEYVDIETDSFRLFNGTDSHIRMALRWHGEYKLWLDYFTVYDQYFKKLVIQEDEESEAQIIALLQQYLPNYTHPRYSHIYFDEPVITSNHSIGRVSDLAEEFLGNYICGGLVPWGYDEYQLINAMRRPRYIMTHDYPLHNFIDTASTGEQNDLQSALNFMISRESLTIISADLRNFPRKQGLRSHIAFAQGFGTGQDHVPLYYTIQCQGDYEGEYGTITEWRRAPTPNEIFVQGWLALCYGAKGLMFYNIVTDANTIEPPPGSVVNCVYGLFDEEGNQLDPNNPQTRWQDQNVPQVRNKRFYAVKSLNEQISRIDTVIMGLAYNQAYSIHSEASLLAADNRVVQSIETFSFYSGGKDLDTLTFVEVGFLEPHQPGAEEEYVIVVNRRCLSDERRDMLLTLAVPPPGYRNWLITDIAEGNTLFSPDSQKILLTIEPGRGKLLRIEPGEVSAVDEDFSTEGIPEDFTLYPAYPNPFNPVTTIRYALPEAAEVNVTVYDITGREIDRIAAGNKTAGYYSIRLNSFSGKNSASGFYLIRLTASSNESGKTFSGVQKVLLLK